jgi:hypothetical protein
MEPKDRIKYALKYPFFRKNWWHKHPLLISPSQIDRYFWAINCDLEMEYKMQRYQESWLDGFHNE